MRGAVCSRGGNPPVQKRLGATADLHRARSRKKAPLVPSPPTAIVPCCRRKSFRCQLAAQAKTPDSRRRPGASTAAPSSAAARSQLRPKSSLSARCQRRKSITVPDDRRPNGAPSIGWARRPSLSGPLARPRSLPAGIHKDGSDPTGGVGWSDTVPDTLADTATFDEPRQRQKSGGRSRPLRVGWRVTSRPVHDEKREQTHGKTGMWLPDTHIAFFLTPPPLSVSGVTTTPSTTPDTTQERSRRTPDHHRESGPILLDKREHSGPDSGHSSARCAALRRGRVRRGTRAKVWRSSRAVLTGRDGPYAPREPPRARRGPERSRRTAEPVTRLGGGG